MSEGYTPPAATSGVTTVAGRSGAVTLAVADVSGAAPAASPTFTGAVTLPAGYAPLQKLVRRTADSSSLTAQTTPQSDDTLLMAMAASETWVFQWYLLVSAANTAMDWKAALSLPVGATASWGGLGVNTSATAGWGIAVVANSPNAQITESGSISGGTFNGVTGVSLQAIVVNSTTPGNCVLQWSQATSDAGALKLLKNSFMLGLKLG